MQITGFRWHRHELCRDSVKRDCDRKSLLQSKLANLGSMIFSVDAALFPFPISEFVIWKLLLISTDAHVSSGKRAKGGNDLEVVFFPSL